MSTIDFSAALVAIKAGGNVARAKWDDGTFVFLVPGSTFIVNRAPLLGIFPEGTSIEYSAHIDICTNNKVRVWSPTNADLLAEDWYALL